MILSRRVAGDAARGRRSGKAWHVRRRLLAYLVLLLPTERSKRVGQNEHAASRGGTHAVSHSASWTGLPSSLISAT